MTNVLEGMMSDIKSLLKRVSHLEARRTPTWVYLASPLTSGSWDGDGYSTISKTKIDLSAVFSAPAGIKAALFYAQIDETTSGDYWFLLSPNDTAWIGLILNTVGYTGPNRGMLTVPCNVDGDVYYQISASGAGSMTINLYIWGYLI